MIVKQFPGLLVHPLVNKPILLHRGADKIAHEGGHREEEPGYKHPGPGGAGRTMNPTQCPGTQGCRTEAEAQRKGHLHSSS